MTTRARLQNANDSKSLWNYTLSPGWSEFDAHILRLAVMRYGCGAWRDINRHFPLKTCGQLNLQTQRLFGQQALAEFQKVHIDPLRIKEINDKKDGFRKNTCLINTGNNLTAKEKEARRQEHIKNYGIPKELYERIQVPVVLDPPASLHSVIDDIEKLREMYRAVYDIQLRIKHLQMNGGKNAANIAVNARQIKNKNKNKNDEQISNNNNNKNMSKEDSKEPHQEDVEMNDNQNIKKDEDKDKKANNDNNDNDVEIIEAPKENENENKSDANGFGDGFGGDMDEEMAMAMALSRSMAQTNINTPAIEKKSKSKKEKSGKKSTKKKSAKKSAKKSGKKSAKKSAKKSSKKKSSRKRKKMDSDDEAYVPGGAQPKKKRARKK